MSDKPTHIPFDRLAPHNAKLAKSVAAQLSVRDRILELHAAQGEATKALAEWNASASLLRKDFHVGDDGSWDDETGEISRTEKPKDA